MTTSPPVPPVPPVPPPRPTPTVVAVPVPTDLAPPSNAASPAQGRTPPTPPAPPVRGSETRTDGLRIRVQPRFVPEHSAPAERKHVFVYRVTIVNEAAAGDLRVLARRWRIIDATGKEHTVEGEGIVGQQPTLRPGQSFEYESWCPLTTAWGTMEGSYRVRREDGTEFDAAIGRFYLVAGE